MLGMYCGTIAITITGIVKKRFKKLKQVTVSFSPSFDLNIHLKAENEEEVIKCLEEIAQNEIESYQKQLAKHLEKGYGIVISGYDISKDTCPFTFTPQFFSFDKIEYKVYNITKIYDFKDCTMKECLEKLTPAEFQKEFGNFIMNT